MVGVSLPLDGLGPFFLFAFICAAVFSRIIAWRSRTAASRALESSVFGGLPALLGIGKAFRVPTAPHRLGRIDERKCALHDLLAPQVAQLRDQGSARDETYHADLLLRLVLTLVAAPSHGQVFGSTISLYFSPAAPALTCHASHRGHVCQVPHHFQVFLSTRHAENRQQGTVIGKYNHIGLYSPACNSKCAAGSPT